MSAETRPVLEPFELRGILKNLEKRGGRVAGAGPRTTGPIQIQREREREREAAKSSIKKGGAVCSESELGRVSWAPF